MSDCHSVALVGRSGSIDWACLRRFDRGSTFARILDAEPGGHCSVRPREVDESTRRYLPHTMVLETSFTTSSGTAVLTDAFAMRSGGALHPQHLLVRAIACTSGEVTVDLEVAPRFDYGTTRPWLRAMSPDRCVAIGGDDAMVISADHEFTVEPDVCRVSASVDLRVGEGLSLCLSSQPAHSLDPGAGDPAAVGTRLDETVGWWRHWSRTTTVAGPYAGLLERSALVLKSLNCAPTGAIIAAPTTSLPEIVGGAANWDYRYCWVRDATLTLDALAALGHHEVAHGFRTFLMRSAAGRGDEVQIMYGCYGERRLPEQELDLAGWRESAPVRIGNAAASQVQLDVYGHILDAVHLWHRAHHYVAPDEWRFLASTVEEAIRRWDRRDAGIWEQRGHPRHFVHSKVMAWVAVDRGIGLAQHVGMDDATLAHWRDARDKIRHGVETRGVDPDRGNFVRVFGGLAVDASLLKLALVGFVDANDARMIATVGVIEADLMAEGFVRRCSGLGLAIAHEHALRQGGVLTARSRPDAGGCFSLVLPASLAVRRTQTVAESSV